MVTASARSLPALTYSIEEDMLANMTCTRFDDKRLTKPLLQPLAHQTRKDVSCTAGGRTHSMSAT